MENFIFNSMKKLPKKLKERFLLFLIFMENFFKTNIHELQLLKEENN